MSTTVSEQEHATLTQDDIFTLSVPGKREEDYAGRGETLTIYEDPSFNPDNVNRTEILDFGDEGFLLNNLLTRDECARVIQEGERIGFCPIDEKRMDYRSSQRILLRSPELSQQLFTRLMPYLKDITISGDPVKQHIRGVAAALKGKWSPVGLNEIWRLCRYNPGGHFGPHYDGHFVRNHKERSLKTFMVYLNADFSGGTTNFLNEGQALYKDETGKFCGEDKNILCRLQPLEGQVIVFNHHRLHEGGSLVDGVKYILRTDVMYQRVEGPGFNPREEKALLLLQDAERYEENREGSKAAECYRLAFKLWPTLADEFNS